MNKTSLEDLISACQNYFGVSCRNAAPRILLIYSCIPFFIRHKVPTKIRTGLFFKCHIFCSISITRSLYLFFQKTFVEIFLSLYTFISICENIFFAVFDNNVRAICLHCAIFLNEKIVIFMNISLIGK